MDKILALCLLAVLLTIIIYFGFGLYYDTARVPSRSGVGMKLHRGPGILHLLGITLALSKPIFEIFMLSFRLRKPTAKNSDVKYRKWVWIGGILFCVSLVWNFIIEKNI